MKNLLIYRTTPLQIGKSPAELLMNRKLRTNLPINGDLLTPHTAKEVVKEKQKQKERQRQYYNKGTTALKPLKTGDRVKLRRYNDGLWSQDGTIVQEVDSPLTHH